MTTPAPVPPTLEDRFRQPDGWRWHIFTTPAGRKLRFGTASPKSRVPDAVVVCLPGLSEFSEKYFELANDLLSRNLSFWVLDWQGQGRSERPAKNPQKRHSASFDRDLEDFDYFISEYVKHASVHPDVGRIPMVMIAHSMGGNLGLRYILNKPEAFSSAAFSAPMVGILGAKILPLPVAVFISSILCLLFDTLYLPGNGDWSADDRDNPARNIFSGDPARNAIHNAWCKADPALRCGGVTFGWLHAALRSCLQLHQPGIIPRVNIPCLFALAGDDALVDNDATRKLAQKIQNVEILDLPGAKHEILMEQDLHRDRFIETFMAMLAKNKIKEKLKTF